MIAAIGGDANKAKEEANMFARIRHVAIYTENYQRTSRFYQTIFGMKKITSGMTNEKGNYDPSRGHISDGRHRARSIAKAAWNSFRAGSFRL